MSSEHDPAADPMIENSPEIKQEHSRKSSKKDAQAVAAERFDAAARTVAGLVGAQALHHGSGSTLGDGLVLSGPVTPTA